MSEIEIAPRKTVVATIRLTAAEEEMLRMLFGSMTAGLRVALDQWKERYRAESGW